MKHSVLSQLLGAIGLLLSVCVTACTESAQDPRPLSQTLLQPAPTVNQARRWYDSTSRASATVIPLDWSHALTLDNAVLLPFQEPTKLFARSPGQGYRFLVVTPGPTASLAGTIVELVLPDKSLLAATAPTVAWEAYKQHHQQAFEPVHQLTGHVLFYSTTYQYLAGYTYQAGVAAAHPTRLKLITRPTLPAQPNASSATAKQATSGEPPINNLFACTPIVTDWYNGESGEYITSTYDYSNCSDGGASWPSPSSPPYGGVPGDGTGNHGGGSGGTTPTSSPTSVIVSPSVQNNPKAECVLTKLQSNVQFQELLKKFQNSSQYNVSFNMGTVTSGATGNCTWDYTTSTANVLINESFFNSQHAIWGATTFFHETYHAQLQQYAIATFGTLVISNWPKPINNMTFQELIGYVDATANTSTQWKTATHNYMAYNNNIMAEGLRAFVQTNYPQTYAQIGSNIDKYNYLSMMGLENTTRFTDEITNKGKDADYRSAIAEFITGELPDCL